jgi:hypothetical protein
LRLVLLLLPVLRRLRSAVLAREEERAEPELLRLLVTLRLVLLLLPVLRRFVPLRWLLRAART